MLILKLENILYIFSLHVLNILSKSVFISPQLNPDSVRPIKIYTTGNYIENSIILFLLF